MKKMFKIVLIVLGSLIAIAAIGFVLLLFLFANPIPPRVRADKVRVACVGDSITYGMGVALNRGKDSYPAQLQKLMGSEYQMLNYGVTGTTLLKSGDKPYWDSSFFRYSQESDPAIVTIMLGTNDSKPQNWNAEDYETQLVELVNIYANLPSHPAVYLLTPPAVFRNSIGARNDIIQNEEIPIILRVGEQTNTPVIDIFSATQDYPEYFPDGIHPNAAGNTAIAEAIYAALSKIRGECDHVKNHPSSKERSQKPGQAGQSGVQAEAKRTQPSSKGRKSKTE
jgi:acyl-CoA thioesterase-1